MEKSVNRAGVVAAFLLLLIVLIFELARVVYTETSTDFVQAARIREAAAEDSR
jgi:hypothetical protein